MARHVQLNNIDHADLRIRTERNAALGDGVMSCPVFPYEFRNLQPHYPIVFTKDATTGGFRPLALFGLEEGENLFLTSDEGWDAAYIPLAMRMQPFLIGFSNDGGGGGRQMEVHIDLDHPRVSQTEGEPVFLAHGGHTPFLQEIAKLLGEVHAGEQSITGFSAMLDELELIEPFTLDITLNDGSQGRLAGYYIIAEESLYGLDAEALGRLQAAGFLQPIYMAVAALSQFRALIDRRNRRLAETQA
ncbi:MAG: multidrug transporter [Alphaproteobacteria bacterium]|nr:MAG: multidrug transporter [Alphaproteobacteria bacterium]